MVVAHQSHHVYRTEEPFQQATFTNSNLLMFTKLLVY